MSTVLEGISEVQKEHSTKANRPLLKESQLQSFLDDGFIVVRDVFSPAEMEAVNAHLWECKQYADKHDGVTPFGYRFDEPVYRAGIKLPERRLESIRGDLEKDPFFYKISRDPRILDIAEQIIGPNIKLFTAQYVGKPAYVGTPHAWHQDPSYWRSHGPSLFSFWISVDGSDVENGCVEFLPGSHKLGFLKTIPRPIHKEAFMQANYMETTPPWTVPTVEGAAGVDLDFSKTVPVILPQGSLSIHNALTVHTSGPNPSPRPRGAVILTYIQADLPRTDGKPCSLPVVRGRAGLVPRA
ncbi:MAG: phytanoyl-CoA dioxygenase family protein [Chthoniobacterales bacterium]